MGRLRTVANKNGLPAVQLKQFKLKQFKDELPPVCKTLEIAENAVAQTCERQLGTCDIVRTIAKPSICSKQIYLLAICVVIALLALFLAPCLSAAAQQPRKISRLGYLTTGDPLSRHDRVEALRQGLRELGYVEGKNIVIEYRYAQGRSDRLPELARELIRLNVDIVFAGGAPATEAAKNATSMLPIVSTSDDPVGRGFVAGLPRPGGNITGVTNLTIELAGKRLELLKEVFPGLSRAAVLCSPRPGSDLGMREVELAAQSAGLQLQTAELKNREDLKPAFAALKRERAEALMTLRSPLIANDLAKPIVDFADKNRLPGIYDDRRFARLGGLMSYGVNLADLDRRAAIYIDRILKGAKPADLPIQRPTKFELVINVKTARALGLKVPAHLLMEADRVIE
jgi:putative tryptophan/tyrosine transport system substrate-binding protein